MIGLRPFDSIDAASISEEELELQLFGRASKHSDLPYVKSSLLVADNGDLFIEEIHLLSDSIQELLIDVICTKKFRPIDSNETLHTSFRLISSSSATLEKLVAKNRFKKELFDLIAPFKITIPPFSERPEDIYPIASDFIGRSYGGRIKLNSDVSDYLIHNHLISSYSQICHTLSTAAALVVKEKRSELSSVDITRANRSPVPQTYSNKFKISLPDSTRGVSNSSYVDFLSRTESIYIQRALELFGWDIGSTAKNLGLSKSALYKKISSFSIAKPSTSLVHNEKRSQVRRTYEH